jgi:hypothetical protein
MGDERDRPAPGHEGQAQFELRSGSAHTRFAQNFQAHDCEFYYYVGVLAGSPFWRGGVYLEPPADEGDRLEPFIPIDPHPSLPINTHTLAAARTRVTDQLLRQYCATIVDLAYRKKIDPRSTSGSELVCLAVFHFVLKHLSPTATDQINLETNKVVGSCFGLLLRLGACLEH